MRSHSSRILWCLLLAFVAGCGGCRGKEAERSTAGAFFPAGAQAFVAVEDPQLASTLGVLVGSHLSELAATSLLPGGEDPFEPVIRELGFDPRTPEGFAKVGLDPARGMAFGQDAKKRTLAVVGVRDARAADRWMEEVARRHGGRVRTERNFTPEEGRERPVVAYLDASGGVRLAFAVAGKWLVASEGDAAVEAVGEALAREEKQSLVATQGYAKIRSSIGENRSIWGWLPAPETKGRGRDGLWSRGLSFGLTVGEKELDARIRLPQGTLALSVLQSVASAKESESLLPYLSERDFLLTRIGGDPQALEPLLRDLAPYRRLRRAGFDPAKEILPLFQPGILVGISLEPEPNLSGGLPVQPSLTRTNPFHFLHTGILARVKDPEKAKAALERLAELGDRLQMQVSTREAEGVTIYSATYAAGDGLTWALLGDKLIAAGGEGAFDALLERVKGEGKAYVPGHPEAFELFTSQPLAVYFDVPRLAAQLRAIPESAFGIGGFRMKALLDGWVSAIDPLRGLAIAYHVDNEGIVLDARLATE